MCVVGWLWGVCLSLCFCRSFLPGVAESRDEGGVGVGFASQRSRMHAYSVDFPNLWRVNYRHPAVAEAKVQEQVERAVDCAEDKGLFDVDIACQQEFPSLTVITLTHRDPQHVCIIRGVFTSVKTQSYT
jgi:hypothetical protein